MQKFQGFKFHSLINIFLGFSLSAAIAPSIACAQSNPQAGQTSQTGQKVIQPKTIYVSPQGIDANNSGSETQPFRTITAAIAANPQEGTIFQLGAGTYSEAAGETFPIRLPQGAILRGNPNLNGTNVVISGGGRFVSPTFASQNIAIVAANNTRIEGLTITNSNPRGYGLWLESSRNLAIAYNNFVRSTHDGLFLTGNAQAYVVNNLFTGNTGSGISAVGTSTGEIRDNKFENTGFGLSIGQESQVLLANNNISRNVDGVVISNTAQPTLRGNTIVDNQRNGLVVISSYNGSPRPDLGTIGSAGNNIFRNNREYDINNATTIPLVAAGNQISRSRVTGLLDFNATKSPIVNPNTSISPSLSNSLSPAPIPNAIAPNSTSVITIEREYVPISTTGLGNQIAALPPVKVDPTTGRPFQYRVIVPTTSTVAIQRVRTIVPDAFRLSRGGRTMLQVGAYSGRQPADDLVQKLARSGFNAEIIPFP